MAGMLGRAGRTRAADGAARMPGPHRPQRPWLYRHVLVTDTKPIVRQSATMVATALAVVLATTLPPIGITDAPAAWTGVGIVAAASLLSLVFSIVPTRRSIALIVPVASLLGLGFFRLGTGRPLSIYTALIFLPAIWIAAEEGRRHITLAFAAALVAMGIPHLVELSIPSSTVEWASCVFLPIVAGLTATYINELSRQAHDQIRSAERDTAEHAELLDATTRAAQRIQEREAQLRTANALTSSVLNSVTEQAIIGTDLAGLIDVWNPGASALLGLSPGEVEGRRHIVDFHVPEELARRAADLGETDGRAAPPAGFAALIHPVRHGEADVRTWTYQKANGARLSVEVAVTPRTNARGKTIGYIFVASDVSHAVKLSRLKDEFLGLISHELRTPLTSIIGYLELLREGDGPALGSQKQHYLDVAERNAGRLLHLVGDLLTTAQVESGAFPIETTHTLLEPLVSAAIESARPAADRAGITVRADLPAAGDLAVTADRARLGQALDNLLSNAIKFTPRGGSVTVRLTRTADGACVSVADTGMGIPAGEIERLGSKFFRATTATRNAVPGTGLGLAIAKAIVHAHGGRLTVRSAEGNGTTFTMTLPLTEQAQPEQALPEQPVTGQAETGPGGRHDTAGPTGEDALHTAG